MAIIPISVWWTFHIQTFPIKYFNKNSKTIFTSLNIQWGSVHFHINFFHASNIFLILGLRGSFLPFGHEYGRIFFRKLQSSKIEHLWSIIILKIETPKIWINQQIGWNTKIYWKFLSVSGEHPSRTFPFPAFFILA